MPNARGYQIFTLSIRRHISAPEQLAFSLRETRWGGTHQAIDALIATGLWSHPAVIGVPLDVARWLISDVLDELDEQARHLER